MECGGCVRVGVCVEVEAVAEDEEGSEEEGAGAYARNEGVVFPLPVPAWPLTDADEREPPYASIAPIACIGPVPFNCVEFAVAGGVGIGIWEFVGK